MRNHIEKINSLYLNESRRNLPPLKGLCLAGFFSRKLKLFSHHAIEFQLNNDQVLLFNLRLYLGVACFFLPLLQGPLTQRWTWIELYERFQVLAGVLALLRHDPGTFEPYPL